jgi:azurin
MKSTTIFLLAAASCAALAVAGCGKSNEESPKPTASAAPAPTPSSPPEAPTVSTPPKPAQHVELTIASVANTMTFDKTALTVPAGAEVHLVMTNHSNMTTLPHNWVLVKTGTEASVAAAGLKRGETAGYIDVLNHDMLAHTPLAKQGETSEVTFVAPEAGTYPYICTVPGHYMLMKGVLTVTP